MIDISNTGERILLDKETPLMIARHFCAYRFARDYVGNKTGLDIGCGGDTVQIILRNLLRK